MNAVENNGAIGKLFVSAAGEDIAPRFTTGAIQDVFVITMRDEPLFDGLELKMQSSADAAALAKTGRLKGNSYE